MDLGAATHQGYVRSGNEDGFFASGEHAVFAVADGMGGHEHGEVASHLVIDAIVEDAPVIGHAQPTELPGDLHRTIQRANAAILSQAISQDARNRMGATVVVATVCGDRLSFAHIGDSRLYLLRGELFTQLTRDHSLVQSMVDRGQITPDEAAIHPLRHQITRVVGGEDYISPEIASQALEPGDIILLCTDGLSGAAAPDAVRDILASARSAQEKADALVHIALEAGGPDNVTAVVVHYERPRPLSQQVERRHAPMRPLPLWQSLLIALGCLLVAAAGLTAWSYTHPVYFISVDKSNHLALYQRHIGLPMLGTSRIRIPRDAVIPFNYARPYLPKYETSSDIEQGIAVPSKDAGISLLQTIAEKAVTLLLEEAKTALVKDDLAGAVVKTAEAKRLGGNPELIIQLERQIEQARGTRQPHP